MELDLSDKGLGVRSRRYAMYVDDGTVRPSFQPSKFWEALKFWEAFIVVLKAKSLLHQGHVRRHGHLLQRQRLPASFTDLNTMPIGRAVES